MALGRIGTNKGDSSKKNDERPVVASKLVSRKANGDLDCSWWRKAKFEDIRFDDDVPVDDEFVSDELFNNKAAVRAFEEFRGYQLGEGEQFQEATIMCLARADAFFTTALNHAREPQKRGGRTGEKYTDEFRVLLPRACEELLASCRSVLERHALEELYVFPTAVHNAPSNKFSVKRGHSRIFVMPSTEALYLALTPDFFKEKVSNNIGCILDCYVGRIKGDGTMFNALKNGGDELQSGGTGDAQNSGEQLATETESSLCIDDNDQPDR